jgi:L-ascorbate metabolism protein UlaG (beta-lactamase superfamily)
MTDVRVTRIGGPTALIEFKGWRLLTDPTFDLPGRKYSFGWGASSRKLVGPAVPLAEIGKIDAVLLSHDHHADNLDSSGRALLSLAGVVLTTVSGARRLGGATEGVGPWQTTLLEADGRPTIEITATPARHGPPLSRPIAGEVTGFALRWPGQDSGALWITGDTVLFDGTREVANRLPVGAMLLHLGGVQFPVTGPVHYSMTAEKGLELCQMVQPQIVMPIHYEGWTHFRQPEDEVRSVFEGMGERVRWLPLGTSVQVNV